MWLHNVGIKYCFRSLKMLQNPIRREMLPETVLRFQFKNFISLDENFTKYCLQFKHKIIMLVTDKGIPEAKAISLVLFSILIDSVEYEQEVCVVKVEIIQ